MLHTHTHKHVYIYKQKQTKYKKQQPTSGSLKEMDLKCNLSPDRRLYNWATMH